MRTDSQRILEKAGATVRLSLWERSAWTGLPHPADCCFPTGVLPEEHAATQTLAETCRDLFREEPMIDKGGVFDQWGGDHGTPQDPHDRSWPGARRPGPRPGRKTVEE